MGSESEADPGQARPKARTRPIFILLLGGVMMLATVATGTVLWLEHEKGRDETFSQADRERRARATPVGDIALAPLPVKSPLVERPGKDEFGYPRSYVDKGGLRALLARKKYEDLNQYLEQFQRAFEEDFHNEYFISDASDAFGSAEAELGAQLDAWVAATPSSFAPYLARASHLFDAGFAARGGALVKDTDRSNFKEMDRLFARAKADLERALSINPRLVAAMRHQLRLAFSGRTYSLGERAEHAFRTCPECFVPRVTYQIGLEPRWGGSYAAMDGAAARAPVDKNPRLKLLAGYSALDRADMFSRDEQFERALEHIERACKLGDHADFFAAKARVLVSKEDAAGARALLSRAVELRPNKPELLFERASATAREKAPDWRAAYADLTAGLRMDPTSRDGRRLLPRVYHGLMAAGSEAHQQGKDDDALALFDLAAELDMNREVDAKRKEVLTAGFHGKPEEIAALEQAIRASPDDYQARIRLDYALSVSHDWPKILAMWNEYLKGHPEDARAYRERSGTLYRLRRLEEALADAQRACDLGSSAGCGIARRAPFRKAK